MSQSDFVTRGQALVGAGQYQEAVKVCRLGLLGRPTTVEGRVVLGQALLALKRYDEVLAEMRVALELDHTSISAQALKGEALLKKGDPLAALDVLQKVRSASPADPRIGELLADAERASGRPRVSANHAAARPGTGNGAGPGRNGQLGLGSGGFGRPAEDVDPAFSTETHTKNYPHHGSEDDLTNDEGLEDTGGSFTRPTSLSAPTAKKRSQPQQVMTPDATPPPAVLAVGDRSGTVEVDPEMDGVEMGDDDLGDVVAPPASSRSPAPRRAEGRGQVIPATGAPMAKQPSDRKAARNKGEISSVELMDDEIMELDDSVPPVANPRKLPGPFTAVRNAVNQPAGPMPDPVGPAPSAASVRPMANVPGQLPRGPASAPQNVAPHLAQLIASQPHVMQVSPPMPQLMPMPVNPRSAIAAAMPTQAAMPVPQLFPSAQSVAAAARQTMIAAPPSQQQQQQQAAAAVDQLFADEAAPAPMAGRGAPQPVAVPWGNAMPGPGGQPMPARIGPDEMTRRPMPVDPQISSMLEPSGASGAHSMSMSDSGVSQAGKSRTSARKGRSRMQVALWVLVGAVMIGGGVFAGFQIRAMRLGKQITAARGEAVSLANTDTWQGWVGARNRLASIAQASSTLDNRAMLARSRALVAYEFGDGLAEAQASVTELAGQGGLDAELAAAFLALAQNDAAAARSASDRALALAANDPAALYASSQAALLAGDLGTAITAGKTALEKESRALYAVGLARAYAAASAWDDGLAVTDAALKAAPEHPGALIVRGALLAEGGRIAPGNAAGNDIRAQLEKVVREGTKPVGEQTRGVSPMQVAYADLALARVDAARGNLDAAKADIGNALAVGLDEQRFAEELVETLYAINLLGQGRVAVDRALTAWPQSRRARTSLAQIALAQGRASEALEVLGKAKDSPGAKLLAVRGMAKLATGDLDGARGDFDTAAKRAPMLELAIAGRTALDLRTNDLEAAKQRVAKLWKPGATSTAMAITYASVMRAAGDAAGREQAKAALEKAIAGGAGIDTARAQLEYARLLRDLGDLRLAGAAYTEAGRAGSYDARFELGQLLIEDRRAPQARAVLDELVKEAGARAPAALLVEAARARMIVGDHAAAVQALEALEKQPDLVRWQLDRERGRLALRRGDHAGAGQALGRALESCGGDIDTFLLAAEVAGSDIQDAKLIEKVASLAKQRLKSPLESAIITGKLALAEGKLDAAGAAYDAATAEIEKGHGTPRLQAQGGFGRAVVAYNKNDDMTARNALDLALALDPSIYAAYLFQADLVREKQPERAFEYAKEAVARNPDLVDGWVMYGTLAHRLRKRQDLNTAVTRVNALAPGSEKLRQLQSLQ